MTKHLVLNQLALTLLALAETAPQLPEETRRRLDALGDDLEQEIVAAYRAEGDPEEQVVALLSTTAFDAFTVLHAHAPFREAKAAWDDRLPLRVGLDLDTVNDSLNNPDSSMATGTTLEQAFVTDVPEEGSDDDRRPLARMAGVVLHALREPAAFATKEEWLQGLARGLGLDWPRRHDREE